jgi:hypothetical protein
MKPFSTACERNQSHILTALQPLFADRKNVLEIASGTGQHAVFIGRNLPHLTWQTSELVQNHAGINEWLAEAQLLNVLPPILLDIHADPWPEIVADAVFNANTVHIVSWTGVVRMFAGLGQTLKAGGVLCLYGPFNYAGEFTSASNAEFDAWLKARDALSGIRDFEAIARLAQAQGFELMRDVAMPSNNRLLVWSKHDITPV